MKSWYCFLFLQLFIDLSCWFVLTHSSSGFIQTKPGCHAKCGSVMIPYPFGIAVDRNEIGCSIAGVGRGYSINCNTSYDPPKPFLDRGNIEVISISDTEIRVNHFISTRCYNQLGWVVLDEDYSSFNMSGTPFTFSYTQNMFSTVGCDSLGVILMYDQNGKNYTEFCESHCSKKEDLKEGKCSRGGGCCQTSIRKGINVYEITISSPYNHTNVSSFDPCELAFLTESDEYSFSASDLLEGKITYSLPLVLDWAIGNKTCAEAQKDLSTYACKANSVCNNSDNNLGYRCICNSGYEGNPYLSPGCLDINECKDPDNKPCSGGTCTNTIGSYTCSCPKGSSLDRKACIDSKKKKISTTGVTLGIGLTILILGVGIFWLRWNLHNRRLSKHKEKLFRQNGGLLLKQHLSPNGVGMESAKIFTAKELELATNYYAKERIIGEGGYGTVYKGTLSDNHVVAIKKSKVVDQSQIEQFINEVVILTQINHRNVVKLLGCCLESEVPLLVYEYISNGTLYQHIHSRGKEMTYISWQSRLRVATETAGALAYLHSAASVPVIHRDIKSTNILLDEQYNAKVSDFGASRLVPLEKTRFTTLVQGTLGYLDPEYYNSSQLTEKSDVYSFGVVLVELLTGQKPICLERSQEQRNLSAYFISMLENNDFLQIFDNRIVEEADPDQILAVAKLARRCLNLRGEERPTMKQVAAELEGLQKIKVNACDEQPNFEEEMDLAFEPVDLYSIPMSYLTEMDSGGR